MINISSTSKKYLSVAVLLLISTSVLAKGDRLRCRDFGPGGREAELRFENDDGELEFRAKWEINLNQGQVAGDVVSVTIDGVPIEGITLFQDGRQLEGKVEFESGEFPSDFPTIQRGTPVEIGSLFCLFERD